MVRGSLPARGDGAPPGIRRSESCFTGQAMQPPLSLSFSVLNWLEQSLKLLVTKLASELIQPGNSARLLQSIDVGGR